MKIKDKVVLKSFLGLTGAPKSTKDNENYWKLIGKKGIIEAKKSTLHPYYPKNGFQVLVVFDVKLDTIGLINHNKIPNSIWIFENDLEKI